MDDGGRKKRTVRLNFVNRGERCIIAVATCQTPTRCNTNGILVPRLGSKFWDALFVVRLHCSLRQGEKLFV